MIINAFLDEARSLYQHQDSNALNTVVTKKYSHLNEEINYDEAVEEIVKH